MKWRFFFGACVLVGYAVLSLGAPPAALAAGMLLAALLNLMQQRKRLMAAKHGSDKDTTASLA